MPRNDQPWQEVRFGVRRPGATQAATSNVSGTLKTRLRAHGGSGQHRPIGVGRAAPIHTIPRGWHHGLGGQPVSTGVL